MAKPSLEEIDQFKAYVGKGGPTFSRLGTRLAVPTRLTLGVLYPSSVQRPSRRRSLPRYRSVVPPRKSVSGSSCTIEQGPSRLILVRTNVTTFATRSNISV
jgi:hypothetical protein